MQKSSVCVLGGGARTQGIRRGSLLAGGTAPQVRTGESHGGSRGGQWGACFSVEEEVSLVRQEGRPRWEAEDG